MSTLVIADDYDFDEEANSKNVENEFNNFYEENGIKRQLTTPRTPEHNGIS